MYDVNISLIRVQYFILNCVSLHRQLFQSQNFLNCYCWGMVFFKQAGQKKVQLLFSLINVCSLAFLQAFPFNVFWRRIQVLFSLYICTVYPSLRKRKGYLLKMNFSEIGLHAHFSWNSLSRNLQQFVSLNMNTCLFKCLAGSRHFIIWEHCDIMLCDTM